MKDAPRHDVDEALARDIEALVSVDHAPSFPARVRARVAQETPERLVWPVRWAALAGVMALAAAAALVWRPGPELAAPPAPPVLATTSIAVTDVPPIVAPPVVRPNPPAAVRRSIETRAARAPSSGAAGHEAAGAPAVVVWAGDAAAFELLLMRIRQGALDGAGLGAAAPAIQIEPIAIAPVRWDEEGDRP